jgi:hypothetical protein
VSVSGEGAGDIGAAIVANSQNSNALAEEVGGGLGVLLDLPGCGVRE